MGDGLRAFACPPAAGLVDPNDPARLSSAAVAPLAPLRLGLVGAGVWGSNYARHLAAMPGVTFAAVADRDPERARALAQPSGALVAPDAAGIARAVDAAVVAVPARSHAAAARPLLEAGVAVLLEQPFAATL